MSKKTEKNRGVYFLGGLSLEGAPLRHPNSVGTVRLRLSRAGPMAVHPKKMPRLASAGRGSLGRGYLAFGLMWCHGTECVKNDRNFRWILRVASDAPRAVFRRDGQGTRYDFRWTGVDLVGV